MSEDAMSQPSETPAPEAADLDASPATGEDTAEAERLLAEAVAELTGGQGGETKPETPEGEGSDATTEPAKGDADDELGDSGKRALREERKARRDAERELKELRARLQEYEDRDKTELEKALERAKQYEQELAKARVMNARLMAAAEHNLPHDLIELLGDGTEEEIDARAKLLAEKLAAAAPRWEPDDEFEEPPPPPPAPTRPVESLTPGARPANERPADPNDIFRELLDARRRW